MSAGSAVGLPTSAAQAERHAETIRKELADTIDKLKDNLRPSQLADEAWTKTRETARANTPEWLERYWEFARSPAGLALIGAAGVSLAGGLLARRQLARR